MANVFVSYGSTDNEKAVETLNMLERAGISCWFAQRDIPPGENYAVEIPRAIKNCEYFVLLLSNESQESPFVKLELDQAIKHRKQIMPVLLEEIHQTEDTNFFLNSKQSVDATTDLASAISIVIQRIRQNDFPKRMIPEQPIKQIGKKREDIRCPHCQCAILKRQHLYVDKYLYPHEEANRSDIVINWVVENEKRINMMVAGCLVFAVLCLLAVASDMNIEVDVKGILNAISGASKFDYIIAILGILLLAVALVAAIVVFFIHDIPDVATNLISAMEHSDLKYWTVKCAKCEEVFSIMLPKQDKLEDHVERLLDDKKENER